MGSSWGKGGAGELHSGEAKIWKSWVDFLLPFLTWVPLLILNAHRIGAFYRQGPPLGNRKTKGVSVEIWAALSVLQISVKNICWILGLCRTGSQKPNQKISRRQCCFLAVSWRKAWVWASSGEGITQDSHIRILTKARDKPEVVWVYHGCEWFCLIAAKPRLDWNNQPPLYLSSRGRVHPLWRITSSSGVSCLRLFICHVGHAVRNCQAWPEHMNENKIKPIL